MKVGFKILQEGPGSVPHNIEMPLAWVTTETAKVCPGYEFVDNCNFFKGVDNNFVTEIFQKNLLRESSLNAAQTGEPVPSVQPLPDLAKFTQPESRRIYTRASCDAGWKEGPVESGELPTRLPGCVKGKQTDRAVFMGL